MIYQLEEIRFYSNPFLKSDEAQTVRLVSGFVEEKGGGYGTHHFRDYSFIVNEFAWILGAVKESKEMRLATMSNQKSDPTEWRFRPFDLVGRIGTQEIGRFSVTKGTNLNEIQNAFADWKWEEEHSFPFWLVGLALLACAITLWRSL